MSSFLAQVYNCMPLLEQDKLNAWMLDSLIFSLDSGWLQKAVRFSGEEGRIIEELQLFQDAQFIDFLQLSSRTVRFTCCPNI